jgi:hypothetical protein
MLKYIIIFNDKTSTTSRNFYPKNIYLSVAQELIYNYNNFIEPSKKVIALILLEGDERTVHLSVSYDKDLIPTVKEI